MRLNTIDYKKDRKSVKTIYKDLKLLEGNLYYVDLPKRFGEKFYELFVYFPEIKMGTSLGFLVRDLNFLIPDIFKQGMNGYKEWLTKKMKEGRYIGLTEVELLNLMDGRLSIKIGQYQRKYQRKVDKKIKERL